jgi:hypothetical protein
VRPKRFPGHDRTAGTYWFTLADGNSDRNIVQSRNKDRTKLVVTILAVPDNRLIPNDKAVIHFEERPSHDVRPVVRVVLSETTVIAAGRTGRVRYGMKPDASYVDGTIIGIPLPLLGN